MHMYLFNLLLCQLEATNFLLRALARLTQLLGFVLKPRVKLR